MENKRSGPYSRELSLLDLLDRLVDKGVVVHGDLLISIAGVDLIYVGLRLLICPVDYLGPRPRPLPGGTAGLQEAAAAKRGMS